MRINRRRGPCRFCGKPVGKGKGKAERSARTGVWLTWHGRCEPEIAGTELPPARKPYYMDDGE